MNSFYQELNTKRIQQLETHLIDNHELLRRYETLLTEEDPKKILKYNRNIREIGARIEGYKLEMNELQNSPASRSSDQAAEVFQKLEKRFDDVEILLGRLGIKLDKQHEAILSHIDSVVITKQSISF